MLGGADNPNGELPSYITGADNAAAHHSKPAKAEKSRDRGSRIPNGCYGIKP